MTKHQQAWPWTTAIPSLAVLITGIMSCPSWALPPPDDIPEEILRLEIITTARSPLDGQPLSAGEYADLQAELQGNPTPTLSSDVRHLVFLLQIRKFLKTFVPFFP